MNTFANSPFGSDTDPRNPVNLPDGVELCRVCDRTKIELMANGRALAKAAWEPLDFCRNLSCGITPSRC